LEAPLTVGQRVGEVPAQELAKRPHRLAVILRAHTPAGLSAIIAGRRVDNIDELAGGPNLFTSRHGSSHKRLWHCAMCAKPTEGSLALTWHSLVLACTISLARPTKGRLARVLPPV
jgi:hypothetical protein